MTPEDAETYWQKLKDLGRHGEAILMSDGLKVFAIICNGEVQVWYQEGDKPFE